MAAVNLPLLVAMTMGLAVGAEPTQDGNRTDKPTVHTANSLPLSEPQAPGRPTSPAAPMEHPLAPVLRWATYRLPAVENLKDYTATLVKQERVEGKVLPSERAALKVRQKPLSVYLRFAAPAAIEGEEVIYVEGQNEGKLWVHRPPFGTMRYDPHGDMAMHGQRYPITEIGLLNLVRRLIEVARQDMQHGECEVKYFPGAKINGRSATMIQVVHPVQRAYFTYYLARVFIDDQLQLPVRYESYDWPKEPGTSAQLIEQYTYLDLKLNVGLRDADFSITNPQYHFPARKP